MEEKRKIRVDVCTMDTCCQGMQFVMPRNEYGYLPDSIDVEEIRSMTIRNIPIMNNLFPVHFELDIELPCRLDFETVKKAFNDEIARRSSQNRQIDYENRLNMREPYEKYCEESENKGRQPERLQYIKSWDLKKYGYDEKPHVNVPYGEVVSWSVIQNYD